MDKAQFVRSTVRPMAEYTFPYLTSVVGIHDANSGRHMGSGLRLQLDRRRVIVTARHVWDEAQASSGGAAISTGYGKKPFALTGGRAGAFAATDEDGDVACLTLPDTYP